VESRHRRHPSNTPTGADGRMAYGSSIWIGEEDGML
jgi:hypothetical protein